MPPPTSVGRRLVPPPSRLGDSVDRVSNQGFDGSVYEAVGGRSYFVELVDGFYGGVSTDLLLRPMYPDDLTAPSSVVTTKPPPAWAFALMARDSRRLVVG